MGRYWSKNNTGCEINPAPEDPTKHGVTDEDRAKWDAKQDHLEFDEAPKEGSFNLVYSHGIFRAIKNMIATVTTAYQHYYDLVAAQLTKDVADSLAASKEATDLANATATDINNKLVAGEFIGPKGDKGDKGEQGNEGPR